MKFCIQFASFFFAVAIIVVLVSSPSIAPAQTAVGPIIMVNTASSAANCAWQVGTGIPVWTGTTVLAECPLNLSGKPGLALAIGGGPFVQVIPAAGSGLTSFAGRTAPAAVPTQNDYSYSMLSNLPTTINCTGWTLTQNGSFQATGCTF